jgi:hypothetical protein
MQNASCTLRRTSRFDHKQCVVYESIYQLTAAAMSCLLTMHEMFVSLAACAIAARQHELPPSIEIDHDSSEFNIELRSIVRTDDVDVRGSERVEERAGNADRVLAITTDNDDKLCLFSVVHISALLFFSFLTLMPSPTSATIDFHATQIVRFLRNNKRSIFVFALPNCRSWKSNRLSRPSTIRGFDSIIVVGTK